MGSCFAPVLSTACPARPSGHSWPALSQLHDIAPGHTAPAGPATPLRCCLGHSQLTLTGVPRTRAQAGGGISCPAQGLTPLVPSWKAEQGGQHSPGGAQGSPGEQASPQDTGTGAQSCPTRPWDTAGLHTHSFQGFAQTVPFP